MLAMTMVRGGIPLCFGYKNTSFGHPVVFSRQPLHTGLLLIESVNAWWFPSIASVNSRYPSWPYSKADSNDYNTHRLV